MEKVEFYVIEKKDRTSFTAIDGSEIAHKLVELRLEVSAIKDWINEHKQGNDYQTSDNRSY